MSNKFLEDHLKDKDEKYVEDIKMYIDFMDKKYNDADIIKNIIRDEILFDPNLYMLGILKKDKSDKTLIMLKRIVIYFISDGNIRSKSYTKKDFYTTYDQMVRDRSINDILDV